uniref:Uncharacterized protein n=1 Tax=viral metagenome TaxID=1070528 RepID=A0A6M3XYF8_9ZZZZ
MRGLAEAKAKIKEILDDRKSAVKLSESMLNKTLKEFSEKNLSDETKVRVAQLVRDYDIWDLLLRVNKRHFEEIKTFLNVFTSLEKTHVVIEKKQLQELCQDCPHGLEFAHPNPMLCKQAYCDRFHPRKWFVKLEKEK